MLGNKKGFTLIELLIVVVIIGILAAIAIPKFSATREKAYFSAMKSDLKNLQSQQEIYYQSNSDASADGSIDYTYASDETNAVLGFSPSSGVTVDITTGDNTGWSATATHAALDAATQDCAVYAGEHTAPAGVSAAPANPGVVTCAGE